MSTEGIHTKRGNRVSIAAKGGQGQKNKGNQKLKGGGQKPRKV